MPDIGRFNTLTILRESTAGVYLDGAELGSILLPRHTLVEVGGLNTSITVFVYPASDGQLIATTQQPHTQVGEFAWLQVSEVNDVGAFLNWGLDKELLLPFSEQKFEPQVGRRVLVRVYLDNSQRIAASTRLDRFLAEEGGDFTTGQAVQLLIADKTDMGYKAIVDNSHWGMLYSNELFQPLHKGLQIQGFIKKVRADKKLDLSLSKPGYQQVSTLTEQIIETLKQHDGFLMITDKSPPEAIYAIFKVSKKVYKKAVGALYKQRRIVIEDNGIRLLND